MAAREQRPGYSVLICPDSDLLKEQIARTLKNFIPAGETWERRVFWGDEEPGDAFWEALTLTGLFAAKRTVVVRQAHLWNAETWKALSSALAAERDAVWPFICLEVGFEKGKFKVPAHIANSACFRFADKKGWIWRQKPLVGPELEKFVVAEAKKAGVALESETLRLFIESAIPEAAAIRMELGKLALLGKGEKISPDQLCIDSGNYERDAFETLTKMEKNDWAGVLEDLRRGQQSSRLFFLIAVIARELRLFWQLQDGARPWMPPAHAAMKTALARGLGKKGVSRGFAIVARAEWLVKSGRQTPEQTLETFCMEMTRLFAAAK